MTPPRKRSLESTGRTEIHSDQDLLKDKVSKLDQFKSTLKKIDVQNQNNDVQDKISLLKKLTSKSNRDIYGDREISRVLSEVEIAIDEAIQKTENIDTLISLLEIKENTNINVHIPTIIIILKSLQTNAPNGMRKKIMTKVKSAVKDRITENEMESIARSMGSKYYEIYQEHKYDADSLRPKTTSFLQDLIQEEADARTEQQKKINAHKLSKESLAIIEAIDIEGKIESYEEFMAKLKRFKNDVQRIKEFRALSDADQKDIENWLDSLGNEIQAREEKKLEFLNKKFDSLAKQVHKQKETSDGEIYLNLGDGLEVPFKTKQEAFDFIEKMKKDADSEFESMWKDIGEGFASAGGLASGLAGFLLWTIPTATPKLLFTFPNVTKDIGAWPIIWGPLYVLAIVGTINYTETLYRRIALDTIGKLSGAGEGKGSLSNLRIPDYGRSDNYFPGDSEKEAKMRNEYLQRIEALEKLKIYGKTLDGRKKIRFEKEFKKTKSYLNVNTDTFWLKAQSLRKDDGMFRRWSKSIIGNGTPKILGGFTGKTYKNEATAMFNVSNEIESIKTGVGYVYTGAEVTKDEKSGKLNISFSGEVKETPEINNIREYINSRRDISPIEKERRIKNFNKFLEEVKNKGFGKEYIKNRLYNIAHEGYLSDSDIKGKIEKQIKERFPFLDEDSNLKSDAKFAEKWEYIKMNFRKKGAKGSPAILTRSDRMLFKFADIVESGKNGGWEGSQAHLDEIFEKIQDGRLEISQIYKGKKIKFAIDFLGGFFNKYGISSPSLTELNRYSEGLSNEKYNKMIEAGEDAVKFRKGAKAILDDGLKIDGEWRDPLRAIKNYIKFEVDNTEEKILTKKLNTLIKEIKDDEQFYNKIDLFRELHKLVNGYYTTHTVLDELNKHIKKEGISKSQKSNIQKFMDLAETGNLNFTEDDMEALRKGRLIYDEAGHYVGSDFGETEQKAFIQELKSIERLDEVAYRQDIGMPDNLKSAEEGLQKRYDTEIKLVDILYKTHPDTRGTTFSVAKEIKAFAPYILDHEYTRGQVKIVLEQIFDGATLTEIVGEDGKKIDDITSDKSIDPKDSFDIKADVFEATRSMYDSLETEAQKHQMIDRISEANISRGDLPTNIKDALDARTPEGKKMAREEAQANEKDAKKARKKGEIKARLEIADEKLSLYLNSLGELLVSDKKTIKAEIERGENLAYFQEKYHGKPFLTGLELIFTQSASAEPDAHSPWDPVPKDIPAAETDVNTSEAVKGNNSEIDMSPDKVKSEKARIDKIFERITLEIMLDDNLTDSAREEKTQLLYNERKKSKTTTGFKDLSGKTTRELINGYTGENSIVNKIRTLSDIKKEIRDILELPEDTKITSYHINEIAEAGKDNKKFSDISTTIKASIDTSIKGEITEAIKKGPRR